MDKPVTAAGFPRPPAPSRLRGRLVHGPVSRAMVEVTPADMARIGLGVRQALPTREVVLRPLGPSASEDGRLA